VITLAALTGPLPKAGVIVVAGLAAAALLLPRDRQRGIAMLGALVLSPPLLLASIWHDSKLHFVHHHPLYAAVAAAAALVAVVALAVAVDRWPATLPLLALLALPFRVSVAGSNLLVPLYFVVGAGALQFVARSLRDGDREPSYGGWLERLLALYIVVYACQSLYSPTAGGSTSGFEAALKNMVFFYVPFALLYCLLVRIEWTPRLVRTCAWAVAVLALALAGVAFVEYAARTTWFSTRLAQENQLYVYFVANSVFFDPNIFGRFLALVMVTLAVLLLYERPPREQVAASAVLAILWGAMLISFSRSSMIALLVGLALLAAIRWRPEAPLAVGAVVVVLGAAAVAIKPTTFGLNQGLNGVSAGRGSVLKGGVQLFGDRPLQGFGSGSFEYEYALHNPAVLNDPTALTASHTTPVTVAAEQGVVGELVYLALVVVALAALVRGARANPARAAIAAAFAALLAHTMLYADFLEDPFAWALLGIGASLARASPVGEARVAYGTKTATPIAPLAGSASGAVARASSTRWPRLWVNGGRWMSRRRSTPASSAT
jgi:putative inorganic carbon (HCO3(-)) transporter